MAGSGAPAERSGPRERAVKKISIGVDFCAPEINHDGAAEAGLQGLLTASTTSGCLLLSCPGDFVNLLGYEDPRFFFCSAA
jgi:hypothetical protein